MPLKNKLSIRGSRTKLTLPSKSINQSSKNLKNTSESKETNESQSSYHKKISTVFHRHACRAHIRDALNHKKMRSQQKSRKTIKNKRFQLHLISEQYRRKMSEGFQVLQQEYIKHRKISWGQESQYVCFDRMETCKQVRLAPRLKFIVDDSE